MRRTKQGSVCKYMTDLAVKLSKANQCLTGLHVTNDGLEYQLTNIGRLAPWGGAHVQHTLPLLGRECHDREEAGGSLEHVVTSQVLGGSTWRRTRQAHGHSVQFNILYIQPMCAQPQFTPLSSLKEGISTHTTNERQYI